MDKYIPSFKILASILPEETTTKIFSVDKIGRERKIDKKQKNMNNEPKSQPHNTISHSVCVYQI